MTERKWREAHELTAAAYRLRLAITRAMLPGLDSAARAESQALHSGSIFALDVVEYEVVVLAIEFLCAMFDAHVAEGVRIDPAAMSIGRFQNENAVAEVVERVGGVETRRACPDDYDIVVRRRFDRAGSGGEKGQCE
jgi:hypothetical protein